MYKHTHLHIQRLVREEDGNSATEYAVMLSLIVITALGAIAALGTKMVSVFQWEYASLPDPGGN